jgi:hypothetical protein
MSYSKGVPKQLKKSTIEEVAPGCRAHGSARRVPHLEGTPSHRPRSVHQFHLVVLELDPFIIS